jgi:hypothetical protein
VQMWPGWGQMWPLIVVLSAVPVQTWKGGAVPVQMWPGWAQSRCRCGRKECLGLRGSWRKCRTARSRCHRDAPVAGVPGQMWRGEPRPEFRLLLLQHEIVKVGGREGRKWAMARTVSEAGAGRMHSTFIQRLADKPCVAKRCTALQTAQHADYLVATCCTSSIATRRLPCSNMLYCVAARRLPCRKIRRRAAQGTTATHTAPTSYRASS